MPTITLNRGPRRLVATTDGGGLLEYSIAIGSGHRCHILRPASDTPTSHLDRALIPMVPWCGRIGGGGFAFGGKFHALEPNVPDFPLPLHGNAFQCPWGIATTQTDSVTLVLHSAGPSPFCYRAELRYLLSDSGLTIDLAVTNAGASPMPISIGLHPWFAAEAGTRLELSAASRLATDAMGLPTGSRSPWGGFDRPTRLPDKRIDATLVGWTGIATLHHPNFRVEMQSKAAYLHLFSLASGAGFCCLEPQTAAPNSVNDLRSGFVPLGPGDRLALDLKINELSTNTGPWSVS